MAQPCYKDVPMSNISGDGFAPQDVVGKLHNIQPHVLRKRDVWVTQWFDEKKANGIRVLAKAHACMACN